MKQSPHKICLDDTKTILNVTFEQKSSYPKTEDTDEKRKKGEIDDLHPKMNQVEQHHDQERG